MFSIFKIKLSITDMLAISVMFFLSFDLAYFVDRHNFTHLIFDYSFLFLSYFFLTFKPLSSSESVERVNFFLIFAIILRGGVLFSIPNLSEDIYRFIWDGRLISLGINPFDFKPNYYFENHLYSNVLTPELYEKLNSKNYFSVYPPVCQTVFAVAVWLFPKSLYGAIVLIKSFILLCEIGTFYLLKKMLNGDKRILIYALNPLIIIELCGNAHFEAAMIFFFLLAIYIVSTVLEKTNTLDIFTIIKSSFFFALSVASKMLPLMLLPFLIRWLGWKKSILYGVLVCAFLVLFFMPLYNSLFINNIRSSLNLYFQKFEFNASVYYVYSFIEKAKWGFNPIITISRNLTLVVIIAITFLVFLQKKSKNTEGVTKKGFLGLIITDKQISTGVFFEKCLFALSIYFLCAAVVHPWYVSFLLVLSLFTQFRYIVLWSFLLPLTYVHYSYITPTENFWVIALEYGLVIGFFIFEQIKGAPPQYFE